MKYLTIIMLLLGCSKISHLESFPGTPTAWNGYDRYDFAFGGKPVMIVAPKLAARGRPWVWYGEFFGVAPRIDTAMLERGYHIVYLSAPDLFGSPEAVKDWDDIYLELTGRYALASKPILFGVSRGALYAYDWAEANPEKVAAVFGMSPVCDFRSWPSRKIPVEWEKMKAAYHFATDEEALAWRGGPIDNLAPLAGVPIMHAYGTADDVAPPVENSDLLAARYRQLGGGHIRLLTINGAGHNIYGMIDPEPVVQFLLGE